MSKLLGSVVKSVVIGLVASYAIKYIQDKYMNKENEPEKDDAAETA
jgi:uncharacterized membrane protein